MDYFDVAIIGTGQAGPPLALRCTSEGLKTVIIERDKFGGTCVNTGCTPTKAMIASARAAHMAKRSEDFGVVIKGSVHVDIKKVMKRKNSLVQQSARGLEKELKSTKQLSVIEGHAQFLDNQTLKIHNREIKADKIFINTGARASVPLGLSGADYLTNSDMMNLNTLPEHLIIVGGGNVGLEFGQMYKRFGSKVTIIEKSPQLIGSEDKETSEAIQSILEAEGIHIHLNAECMEAVTSGDKITVHIDCKNGPPKVSGTHLLAATGRIPNTDDLGIENTGIKTDKNGYIQTDDSLKTSAPNIWALGDCNGRGAFTHTAYNDYEIAAANLFGDESRNISDRIFCYSLFTDPPLSRIGINGKQAEKSEKNILVGYKKMADIARAREKGETAGFIRIFVDADTERILGAVLLGTGSDEVIHSLLDIMYADQSYKVIRRAVHIHPTISELIPDILKNLEPLQNAE